METGLTTGLSKFAEGKLLLHLPSAVGALCNVKREHARQQLTPGQAMGTRLALRLGLHLGLISVSGHDPGAISGAGCQNTVVAYQIESWWGHKGGQFLEQFKG